MNLKSVGMRRSQLGIMLSRYASPPSTVHMDFTSRGEMKRKLKQWLEKTIPRMSAVQLVAAVEVSVRWQLQVSLLNNARAQLKKDHNRGVFQQQPGRITKMLALMSRVHGSLTSREGLQGPIQSFVSFATETVAATVRSYSTSEAAEVFCSLVRLGGVQAFDRMQPTSARRFVSDINEHIQLRPGMPMEEQGFGSKLEPALIADLVCAMCQLEGGLVGKESAETLGRHLEDKLHAVAPQKLSTLAQALNRLGDSHDTFVLLHAICRQSAQVVDELPGPSVVDLLQVFGRHELYDQAFLEAVSEQLGRIALQLSGPQICDAIYAFNAVQVRDSSQLDILSNALTSRVDGLHEADIVRALKGLGRSRHRHDALLSAIEPVINRDKQRYALISLSNLLGAYSLFGVQDESFDRLLEVILNRIERMNTISVHHLLVALCRQHRQRESLESALASICYHMASHKIAMQLTPVQATGSLVALARLQYRELNAVGVILQSLVGDRGLRDNTWAPSAFYYRHRSLPSCPFSVESARATLSTLDVANHVDILQSFQRLDLHSALVFHLIILLREMVLPHLHDLRAREVISFARSFGSWLPAEALPIVPELHILGGGASTGSGEDPSSAAAGDEAAVADGSCAALTWKDATIAASVENLRRHEFYLEASWPTLLPLQLLCLEVDSGIYGSRPLNEILSSGLLDFLSRIRHLSEAECEEIRKNRLADEDGEESGAAGSTASPDATAAVAKTEGAVVADDGDSHSDGNEEASEDPPLLTSLRGFGVELVGVELLAGDRQPCVDSRS